MQAGISAGVGLLCLVGAVVLIVFGQWQWPRLIVALVLSGVAGLLNATFGRWLQHTATRVDGKVAGLVGSWTGVALTGVVGLVLVAALGFWVWHGRIDGKTVGVAAAVPLTVSLIPGPLGAFMLGAVAMVPAVLGGVIAWLFGAG